MNQFTTLYGSVQYSDNLKHVDNFFHYVKSNPFSKKSKSMSLCNGCFREFAKKNMVFLRKTPSTANLQSSENKSDVSFGHSGRVSITIFENILTYLPMPSSIAHLMLVHKAWRNFFMFQTDFSWFTNFTLGEPKLNSFDPLHYLNDREKSNTTNDAEITAAVENKPLVWSDNSILQFLKIMKKNCRNFFGLQYLKKLSIDPSSSNQNVTDFGLLCLSEAMYPSQTLEYIDLSKLDKITWIGLVDLAKCSQSLKGINVSGEEMYRVIRKFIQSKFVQTKISQLQELQISNVKQLGLSILIDIQDYTNLQSLSLVNSSLFWEQKRDWSVLKPLENIKSLDVFNSTMPLRDSLTDIFSLFPNIEHLHCSYIQQANLADKVEMFKKCGSKFTEDILIALDYRVTEPDEFIIKKGEIGHEMYFLEQGKVQIIGDEGKVVAELESGIFFGEISLLFDTPRTATVRAIGTCHLYVLDQPSLFRVMRLHPQSKDIIKEEAKRRWNQLQNQSNNSENTTVKEDLKENESEKEVVEPEKDLEELKKIENSRPPTSKLGFIPSIQTFSSKLKSLYISAKGLNMDLNALLKGMGSLQTLYLKLETLKVRSTNYLEFPKNPNELASLKTIRLHISESQYSIPAEAWIGLGPVFPKLENLGIIDAVSNSALSNICTEWPNLEFVILPNSSAASKSVLQILNSNSLVHLVSDADISGDQIVRAITRSRPPLQYLSLHNSIFNESQLVKLFQNCHYLQYVCIQTSTMNGVDPAIFKVNHPQYAHINLVIHRIGSKRRNQPTASLAQLGRVGTKSSLQKIGSQAIINQKDAIKGRLEVLLKENLARQQSQAKKQIMIQNEKDAIKGKLEMFFKQKLAQDGQGNKNLKRKSDGSKEVENGSTPRQRSPRQIQTDKSNSSTPRSTSSSKTESQDIKLKVPSKDAITNNIESPNNLSENNDISSNVDEVVEAEETISLDHSKPLVEYEEEVISLGNSNTSHEESISTQNKLELTNDENSKPKESEDKSYSLEKDTGLISDIEVKEFNNDDTNDNITKEELFAIENNIQPTPSLDEDAKSIKIEETNNTQSTPSVDNKIKSTTDKKKIIKSPLKKRNIENSTQSSDISPKERKTTKNQNSSIKESTSHVEESQQQSKKIIVPERRIKSQSPQKTLSPIQPRKPRVEQTVSPQVNKNQTVKSKPEQLKVSSSVDSTASEDMISTQLTSSQLNSTSQELQQSQQSPVLEKKKSLKKKSNQLTPIRTKESIGKTLKSPYSALEMIDKQDGQNSPKKSPNKKSGARIVDDAPIALLFPTESRMKNEEGKRIIRMGKKSPYLNSPLSSPLK